jgi:hypothetical protein
MLEATSVQRTDFTPDGFIGVQVPYFDDAEGAASHLLETHHPYGFIGRPDDADDKGACNALTWFEGDKGHALFTYDARTGAVIPKPPKGSSAQYSKTGAFALLDGETGDYTVYIPNADGSKAHMLWMSHQGDACVFAHADGMALRFDGGTACLKSDTGEASIVLKGKKIQLIGDVEIVGTAPVLGAPVPVSLPLLTYLIALETVVQAKLVPTAGVFAMVPAFVSPLFLRHAKNQGEPAGVGRAVDAHGAAHQLHVPAGKGLSESGQARLGGTHNRQREGDETRLAPARNDVGLHVANPRRGGQPNAGSVGFDRHA